MVEREWSENPEDDPIELQKKQLELGKKFLKKVEEQEAKEREKEEQYRAAGPAIAPSAYRHPTFEEVSAAMKKAWDEVSRIMPDATDAAKSYAFQTLVHAQQAATVGFLGV